MKNFLGSLSEWQVWSQREVSVGCEAGSVFVETARKLRAADTRLRGLPLFRSQSCLTLCNPGAVAHHASLSFTISRHRGRCRDVGVNLGSPEALRKVSTSFS